MRFRLHGLVLGVLFTGCTRPRTPTRPTTDCRTAIAAFATADPARVTGLPRGCTLADVARELTSLDASSRGSLGPEGGAFDVRYFKSAALAEIHAWLGADGAVALLDADTPPGVLDAFVAALGEPEARLDYPRSGIVLEKAEVVWPAKGVVFVAGTGVKGLIRIGVFAPPTLVDYQARLRYKDIEPD